jgi:hypothetical protein
MAAIDRRNNATFFMSETCRAKKKKEKRFLCDHPPLVPTLAFASLIHNKLLYM